MNMYLYQCICKEYDKRAPEDPLFPRKFTIITPDIRQLKNVIFCLSTKTIQILSKLICKKELWFGRRGSNVERTLDSHLSCVRLPTCAIAGRQGCLCNRLSWYHTTFK